MRERARPGCDGSSRTPAGYTEGSFGQGHIAILAAFAVVDMEEHTGAVHILHPEVDTLVQAQAAGVDGGQAGAIALQADQVKDAAHLFDAEDDRQLLFPLGADELDRGPVASAGVVVEELDAAQGDGDGRPRVLLEIGEVEEILAEFLLGDPVGRFVVVFRQLADGAQVGLLGFLGHAAELHVFEHALSELRCHDVPPLEE